MAILPMEHGRIGFENEIQRIYVDCLTYGGRLSIIGEFPVNIVLKARESFGRRTELGPKQLVTNQG